jgi:hypothetical protein
MFLRSPSAEEKSEERQEPPNLLGNSLPCPVLVRHQVGVGMGAMVQKNYEFNLRKIPDKG